MQKFGRYILFLLFLITITSHAQNSEVINNYISKYKYLAIQEMQRTGVPASITLAQGIHESGAGMGKLALASNNHFGIKCKSNWTGETVKHDDDAKKECFRKYPSSEDSYKDHSDFLKNSTRYASLFSLDPADYEEWANGLKKAGYATNPKYPQVLIKLIEDYHLQDYTLIALEKISADYEMPEKISEKPDVGTISILSLENALPVSTKDKITNKPSYPDGEFKINDTRVVYVKKGTSFLAIALQFNVDLARIFEFNEIPRAEETEKDQLIYLQRKRKTGNNIFHIVQPGETLHDIAQLEAIRLESLLEFNWLSEEMQPAIGEKLSLQKKSASIPRLVLKDNYSFTPAVKK